MLASVSSQIMVYAQPFPVKHLRFQLSQSAVMFGDRMSGTPTGIGITGSLDLLRRTYPLNPVAAEHLQSGFVAGGPFSVRCSCSYKSTWSPRQACCGCAAEAGILSWTSSAVRP